MQTLSGSQGGRLTLTNGPEYAKNGSVHPCQAYCERHSISQARLARYVDISPQFLCDIIQGRSRPGDAVKRRIVMATGGEITLQDLVNWERSE
jgi:hypothetical protein